MKPRCETYRYRAFGINVRSEIEFPELNEAAFPDADIEISLIYDTPSAWPESSANAWRFDMAAFRLRLAGIAEYEVDHGTHIRVTPSPDADPAQVRIHLLTVCMAAALMQRGRLLLHASGILHQGRALLFAGESGSGKSSVVAELRRRGYRFLTDDTCVIEPPQEGAARPVAHPSYPMLKLTAETLDKIGDPRYDRSLRIWPGTEKYGQILREEADSHGVEIGQIYVLGYTEADIPVVSSELLYGNEAFLALSRHIYRREFIHESALQQAHLKTIGSLVGIIPVRYATRRRDADLGSFCDRIEEWMCKNGSEEG
ncbi:MAG: hypothetical protein EBZ67_03475 [Chitinophagia bacterium]|nr:hypothetical protein [Chitinophagia bacterium]